MIDAFTASICGASLVIAGCLEFICNGKMRMVAFLAAFGFLMLGWRYFYLVHMHDLARLNIYGTASIGAIALARIIACVEELRR